MHVKNALLGSQSKDSSYSPNLNECSKSYTRKNNITNHKESEHNGNTYQKIHHNLHTCNECSKSFTRKNNMKNNKKLVHKGKHLQ